MNHLSNSKWTSVLRMNGWRHYEVLNIFKKKKTIEMFCVCEKNIKIIIPMKDLKNKNKWLNGWVGKEESKKRKNKIND
tara:strand:- start:4390 stop:4623 length:234 start_codon:yes stop_codon:yes gene_type:complete